MAGLGITPDIGTDVYVVEPQGAPSDTFSIIGFLPIADNMAFTHHFTVYGRTETMNGQPCEKFKEHLDMIYGWSPGEPPQAMPDHVALFAGGNSYRSFRLGTCVEGIYEWTTVHHFDFFTLTLLL